MSKLIPPHPWLARVRHDLAKRLLWVARDCRDAGRQPAPGELVATLVDDEGQPIDAISLWNSLAEQAPAEISVVEFRSAIVACVDAAERNDLAGVLGLELAFEQLIERVASSLNGAAPTPTRKAR